MPRSALSLVACLCVGGCAPAPKLAAASAPAAEQPDARAVAARYRSLQAMTREPITVDPTLAMLCRGATQGDVEAARRISGPHAHTEVSIFMNALAAGAFGRPGARYPVGAIVVKEKRPLPRWSSNQFRAMTRPRDGVGGMIKRSPGYDPEHGDWEYFYFEDAAKLESGRISSCIHCHTRAAERDYVFGDWAAGREM